MAEKKYLVTLTKDEETLLRDIINKGKHAAQKRKRAQTLLLAHEGCTDETIADRAGMHCRGIEGLRQRFVEDGEVSLEGKERGHRPRVLSGEDEARLAALECMDECPKQFFSFYFWGRCGGYPPQRGVGRNEVRPRGEASPHLITPAGKGT